MGDSRKHYHFSFIAAVLIGLWLLLRPSVSIPAPQIQPTLDTAKPATVDTLTLRHKGAVVFADFPQPFLYEYGAPISFLAPVGIALHFAYYNFVKTHSAVRCTAAMAAGVEKSFLTVGDLVEAA